MNTSMNSVNQIHRDIASLLGGPIRTVVTPIFFSAAIVRWAIDPFKNDFSLGLLWAVGIVAAFF